jgi:phosphoenolpyruvate carboxylase
VSPDSLWPAVSGGGGAAALAQLERRHRRRAVRDAGLDRSTEAVLATVGASSLLEHEHHLREGLDRRRTPVGALSHLQLRALRRVRSATADGQDPDPLATQLLVTVNGVAAGLRNTG